MNNNILFNKQDEVVEQRFTRVGKPIEIVGLQCWMDHVIQLIYGDIKW